MATQDSKSQMADSQPQSEDTYPNAGRDSGYVAPVGEDLVNKLSILISGIETKLLLQGQDTRTDIATIAAQQTRIELQQQQINEDVERRAQYFYSQFGNFLKDADARFNGYDGAISAVLEAVRSLGGLSLKVEDHEERIVSLETHGVPVQAIDDIHDLRIAHDKRFGRLEFLIVCLTIGLIANALIYVVVILFGGG